MSTLSLIPTYQYSTGEVLTAAVLNNPLSAIQAWSSTIDNTNIGTAGVFASQLKPTNTTQSTFGGSVGYTFLAPASSYVPLTVSGVSGQSVDIFDVTLTSGGTKAFGVTAVGHAYFGAIGSTGADASVAYITGDLGASIGMILNVPAASTNGFQFSAGNSTVFTVDKSGVARFSNAGGGVTPASASIIASAGGGLIFNNTVSQNFFFTSGAAAVNSLANINGTTGNYTATSDAKLKENVADLTLGLDALLQLRPVTFDWIKAKAPGQGFIAQEVQKIIPNAVSFVNEKADLLGISDALLTPVVVKAIQELTAELRAYTAAHP